VLRWWTNTASLVTERSPGVQRAPEAPNHDAVRSGRYGLRARWECSRRPYVSI